MPTMETPEKLLPLLRPKRYKIIIGGRGSGKSQTVGDMCLKDSQVQGLKIGCFRELMNSIEDSVHALLGDEITRLGLQGFTVQNNKIFNEQGGEFKYRGLARNPDAMKSMHGFERFWVEEAQTISNTSLRLLTPTLRKDDSEIWMTANPKSSADPFSQRFIVPFLKELERDGYYEDEMHMIIVCNYTDNPLFPQVLEDERLFDKEHLSIPEYEHIWLGKFYDEVEGSIIPVKWFDAAIDSHIKLGFQPIGAKILAYDPSDEGQDPKGLVLRHGSVVLDARENDAGDANEGTDWATDYAVANQVDIFRWDCDGLGVSLKRQVSTALDGKRINIDMFKGSESAERPDEIYQPDDNIDRTNAKTNRQTFKNKRAQSYWMLRDRFYATYKAITTNKYTDPEAMISISSAIELLDQLRTETCKVPKKYNVNGMIQIMSKKDMWDKHKIPSPNLADSLMMTMPGFTRIAQKQYAKKEVKQADSGGWT